MAAEENLGQSDVREEPGTGNDAVQIVDVREASGDDRQLIELWGKFWGSQSDFHGVFDVVYDTTNDQFRRREYRAFEDRGVVDSIEVPPDHNAFSREVATMKTAPGIPDATVPQINSFVKEFFEGPDHVSALVDGLKKRDPGSLKDTLEDMVRKIIPRGEIGLEAGVSLTTETPARSQTDDGRDGSVETTDGESDEGDRDLLEATVSTDPVNGMVPRKLSPGDTIYVHVKGDIVERLPDELSHDRYENLTVPMAADVREISQDIDPPEGVDPENFEPSDYWKIECELEEYENRCRAIVQGDTMIKNDVDRTAGPAWSILSSLISPWTILWLALTILGAMLIGYVLFGV